MKMLFSALILCLAVGYSQGAWGGWSGWSSCTETVCGIGIQSKTRTCTPSGSCGSELPYELRHCHEASCTLPEMQEICDLIVTTESSTGYYKEIQSRTCNDVCGDHGLVCTQALKLYQDVDKRLLNDLTQFHVYGGSNGACTTIYSNTCCCVST